MFLWCIDYVFFYFVGVVLVFVLFVCVFIMIDLVVDMYWDGVLFELGC